MKVMRLQSVVFPTEEKHQACRKLFYRGDHGIIDKKARTLSMGYAQHYDFATYLNACSWKKIQQYSKARDLTLRLIFKGKIRVTFVGYTKKALTVERRTFASREFSSAARKTVSYKFPSNEEQMVGFEVTALKKSTLYGGEYDVSIDEKDMQEVALALVSTTCRKEEFILQNTKLIQSEILSAGRGAAEMDREIAEHTYFHIVDNGRSLSADQVQGAHTYLHANPNVGGSGGFARGMMESLEFSGTLGSSRVSGRSRSGKEKITHMLLMDDDVMVLPESIKRTYALLRILRPKYRNAFIAGAMLYYERPYMQHEDIGTVIHSKKGWDWRPLKKPMNQEKLSNNLDNEYNYPLAGNSYAAWWYCCIPRGVVEKNGLPLPLFVRGDDIEYSLRAQADLITLNGICIWHLGAKSKYNFAFDVYQNERNILIAQSMSGVLSQFDALRSIKSAYRREIIQFSYGGAEMAIKALEDYLKGPGFLREASGEEIVKENMAANDVLVPLEQIEVAGEVNKLDTFYDPDLTVRDRLIAKYTYNGHRFLPRFLENDTPEAISFDGSVQAHRIILKNRLVAINPYDSTGVLRVKDRKKFRELNRRYKKAVRQYKHRAAKLKIEYRNAFPEFTSKEFWKKYLGI